MRRAHRMPAMRRPLLLLALTLSACTREPEPPPSPSVRVVAPRPPVVNRIPPAPLDRIAFLREDGIWTVSAGGADLQRLVPATCPRPADPTWATDRRWLAFSAGLDPESNLYPRNLYLVRPDGADFRQVTPMPRSGIIADDGPKGTVRGRAVVVLDQDRKPLPGLRVNALGMRKADVTDGEGNFQTFLPAGGGWIKLSGEVDGKPSLAWRFAAVIAGHVTDLKDVPLLPGVEDEPGSPAWCDDGRQILYLLRTSKGSVLRRIRLDGSGDETVLSLPASQIIAGPVVRQEQAWLKRADGKLLRVDLKTKTVAETRDCGICAPDALAVSPDGGVIATLTLDQTLTRRLILSRKDSAETLIAFAGGEPSPRGMDFSPDGTRLVLDKVGADGKSSLWILTLATKAMAPLVDNGSSPVWHGR
jgi:hypothetical protein